MQEKGVSPPPDELKTLPIAGDVKWQGSLLIHSQCFPGMLQTTYLTGVHMNLFIYYPFSKYSRGFS